MFNCCALYTHDQTTLMVRFSACCESKSLNGIDIYREYIIHCVRLTLKFERPKFPSKWGVTLRAQYLLFYAVLHRIPCRPKVILPCVVGRAFVGAFVTRRRPPPPRAASQRATRSSSTARHKAGCSSHPPPAPMVLSSHAPRPPIQTAHRRTRRQTVDARLEFYLP